MNGTVYAILVIQYTVHVQGRIATFAFWKWVIAPLLDRKFNHSRKCLEVPIREIYGVYSIPHNSLGEIVIATLTPQLPWDSNIPLDFQKITLHYFCEMALCEGVTAALVQADGRNMGVRAWEKVWQSLKYSGISL